ncbi:RNA polymerase sigma factor [Lentzea sp. NPDC059081]|uniref:RNA polymerase sigma factor n=1 Tax=Lentzea sp. NPDC059081 TaxID=3346719 RepID=UPI00367B7B64
MTLCDQLPPVRVRRVHLEKRPPDSGFARLLDMTNQWAARDGRESALPSSEEDEEVVFRICISILREPALARAATNMVLEKVRFGAPEKFRTSRRAWVRKVARNTAIDFHRRETRERARVERFRRRRTEVQEGLDQAIQVRLDAKQLFDRVLRLVADVDHDDLDLFFEVNLGNATEQEQADRLGITLNAVKERRRRARTKCQEAAAAVYLLTDADHGCTTLPSIARNREDSPELLRDIRVHISRCACCKDAQPNWRHLRFSIFVILGVVFCGPLVGRFAESGTRVKLAACAGLVVMTVATGIFFLQGATGSDTSSAFERGPIIELPAGPRKAAPEAPLPAPPVESPTVPPTEAPARLMPTRVSVTAPPMSTPTATVPAKPAANARSEHPTRTHRPEPRRTADSGKKCRKTQKHWDI